MGNHLKAWREHRGLTQDGLAQATGTDKSQISKLEKGQRRLTQEWLTRLAQALRTSPAALLSPPGEAAGATAPRGPSPSAYGPDEVVEADVSEAELLVLDILRDLPKPTQRNIIRAAIRQLDHMSAEGERKPAPRRRRALEP